MSSKRYKILVTLDNGKEVFFADYKIFRFAEKKAERLRRLGYGVRILPEFEPSAESESVSETVEYLSF